MFKPFELFVGLRYTRAKRKNHFISFISATSMVGIALGVAALIVVLSVMNGFQKELRATILGVVSHVQVIGMHERFENWQEVVKTTKLQNDVIGTAPFVSGEGLLTFGQRSQGAIIRGVLPNLESDVSDVGTHMVEGSLDTLVPGEFNVVLGIDLARSLGIGVGDRLVMITPQGQVTPAGVMPRLRQFLVSGIFEVRNYEYDAALAIIHMSDAQKLLRLGDSVSGLRLKLKDLFNAPRVASELSRTLPTSFYVSDWTQSHATFFRAIQIEKRAMSIILLLIVAVAAFNIVSTLVMVVTDKRSDIAILRTLGALPTQIMKIFFIQGALIGFIGTVLGLFFGLIVASNIDVIVPAIEGLFGVQFLAKDVYYISDIPSEIQLDDVIWIGLLSLGLTMLATIYPSLRAAKVNPSEALRYE
ncbi:MAG: lipoprotein-releasing ABC transporter permease subunit [Proteobacteria bacterium]|jgi:lipoprotein-releasing system permease protein|nr:lipoprotein-releasing ABC transporter permease subunit [Pseudomonadota bacterium]MDA0861915.1 lipoprotein-releasing ABC transporter permease subunit [Pseudomonadota bacterium]MDA1030021.1 lipoprotein-releasing ABC transporter permease subunit [Pseudomonadota bacterium]